MSIPGLIKVITVATARETGFRKNFHCGGVGLVLLSDPFLELYSCCGYGNEVSRFRSDDSQLQLHVRMVRVLILN